MKGNNVFVMLLFFVATMISFPGFAAETAGDESDSGPWKLSGTVNANGSFTQYDNWQAGGSDTVAAGVLFNLAADYRKEKVEWRNAFKLEYGMAKVEGEDARKSADVVDLTSVLTRDLTNIVSLYGRLAVSTSMAKTYQYYDDPVDAVFDDGRDAEYGTEKVRTADGFEPINLDQGAGLSFRVFRNEEDTRHLLLRTGAGARQLVASDYYVEDDDEDTDTVEFSYVDDYAEIGAEAGLDFKWAFSESTMLTSVADAFYGFDEEFWKIGWDTSLNFKITKHFGAGITASMVYDELVIDDPQWKTSTMLTLSYQVF